MKNKGMKPVVGTEHYLKFGLVHTETQVCYCPKCNHVLNAGPNYQPKYCSECGKKIDFSDVKWAEDKNFGIERGHEYV